MAEIKRKKKFNIVDLVLVLVIAAVVVAVVFVGSKLLGGDQPASGGTGKVMIEYSIQFIKIPDSGTGNINDGDVIRDANSKVPMGQVTEIFYEPYSELVCAEGEQAGGVMAEMEGFTNMTVTVRSEATKDEKGYYLSGVKLLVAQQLNIWSPGYSGQGWCMGIREVS